MSWERDPLWAKAKLFFERAFEEPPDDPMFGLWCSLGIELLGRAAVASVSPTLLAEADNDHRYLLHALYRGSERLSKKSIRSAQVFALCRTLFPEKFLDADFKAVLALINRRNDELHTGAAAFDEYPSRHWLPGFYRACHSLAKAMDESLENLFGMEQAEVAGEILDEVQNEVTERVQSSIAAHRKVFKRKAKNVQEAATKNARLAVDALQKERHHAVPCPACNSMATIQGQPFGAERVSHEEDAIAVRQAVSPRSFECLACELKLDGYAELSAADLGGHYTRVTKYAPEEFYGLMDPDTFDFDAYFREHYGGEEYDNE